MCVEVPMAHRDDGSSKEPSSNEAVRICNRCGEPHGNVHECRHTLDQHFAAEILNRKRVSGRYLRGFSVPKPFTRKEIELPSW